MIKLVEKEHCSGCTACMACCPKEAISMCADEEGFKYPVIDRNRCVECGKCVRTCPITNKQKKNPVVASYIAINNNKNQREASASGGLFSVIAHYVLERNGVVFGAAYDEKLRVKHIAIEHEADLEKLRMSKYVQSDLGDTFKQVDKYLKADADAAGLWWKDRIRASVEAIANIALNYVLVKNWGVFGIVIATAISILFIGFPWSTKIVFDNYFKGKSFLCYMRDEVFYAVITIIVCFVTYEICNFINVSGILGLIIYAVICVIVPNVLYLLIYFKSRYFKDAVQFVKKIVVKR